MWQLFVKQPNDCLQVRCTSVCCFALAPSSPDQGCFARSCSTKLSFMLKGPRAGCRILNETSWLAGYCCIMHFSGDVFSPFCIMLLSELCYTSGSKPDNLSQTYPCLLFVSHGYVDNGQFCLRNASPSLKLSHWSDAQQSNGSAYMP